MSSAEVVAGTTVTSQPKAASILNMFCFIPKSYATTWSARLRTGPRFKSGAAVASKR